MPSQVNIHYPTIFKMRYYDAEFVKACADYQEVKINCRLGQYLPQIAVNGELLSNTPDSASSAFSISASQLIFNW